MTTTSLHDPGGRRRRRSVAGVLTALVALLLTVLGLSPAHATLAAAGPVDPATGFPAWFEDTAGLRLGLCLDSPNCLATSAELTPPDGEAFWFQAEASLPTVPGMRDALLVLATEAAYAGDGPGQESAFNRVRVRVNVAAPGTYTV